MTDLLNGSVRRFGLSAIAVLLLSAAAMAQEAGDATSGAADPSDGQIVQNWHDLNPAGGDQGIAVGEPDPTSGGDDPSTGGDDPGIAVGEPDPNSGGEDPGIAVGEPDPNSGDPTDDGVEVQNWHDLNPNGDASTPEVAYESAGVPQPNERTVKASKQHRAAPTFVFNAAQCLAQHPQLPWLCGWQNGVGQ